MIILTVKLMRNLLKIRQRVYHKNKVKFIVRILNNQEKII
jgi:hypothetical protein